MANYVTMPTPVPNPEPTDEPAATPDETLESLLNSKRQRGRRTTPIRRSFLQDTTNEGRQAPLSFFVKERRSLALDLYYLLHCTASAHPWDLELPAMAWARALDLKLNTSSETTVSKNWTWLEGKDLIRSERHNRKRKVFLMAEDATGEPYTRAKKGDPGRGFFALPFVYFEQRWHKELTLPGKAVLSIALGQKSVFTLVTEQAADWYGISADTLQRGLDDLRDHGLLKSWLLARKDPRARHGVTQVSHHKLNPPFGS